MSRDTVLRVGDAEMLESLLRLDQEYVWALYRPAGVLGWHLARQQPAGGHRRIVLPSALGQALARNWGRTRNGRPVGRQSVGRILNRLHAAPAQAVDPYPLGAVKEHAGVPYTIVRVVRARRARGVYRAFATRDAGPIAGEPCGCVGPRKAVEAVDLVCEVERRGVAPVR